MARRIEIQDLARLKYVGDPQLSPDGTEVAFVVTAVDLEAKAYQSAIWLASTHGDGDPRQFTAGTAKDTAPRWSPDGSRLAFISDRDGVPQLYVMRQDGGEPTRLTDLKHGVADPAWSPDGSEIAFTSKVDPEGPVLRAEESEEDRERERQRSDVKVIRRLKYKLDGEGFLDDRRRHIFVVPADGGRPRQITNGDWDDSQPTWSPDGREIAFVSNRTDERDRNTLSDIWLVPLDGSEPRPITRSDGQYSAPTFSPNGEYLAFVGHPFSERYGPNTIDSLWLAPHSGGEIRNLTASLDREVGNSLTSDAHYTAPAQRPLWSPDGHAIYVLVSDRGNVPIMRVALDREISTIVGGPREVLNFSLCQRGTLAFLASDPTHPLDVFVAEPDGANERQVSAANAELLAELTLSQPEHITYTTDDGTEIDGWLLKPPDFRPGVHYPLILEIHGGPHAMYGNTFFHELQVLAARGYVVLYTNPRGSTGCGQPFVAGAMGDWGGVDYHDLMAGVDHVLSLGFIDETRLGVTGGSYGGYMTNWMISQTDRFRAAVTQRSTSNRHNLVGTSDLVWSYTAWEFRGLPFDNPEFYLERSPLTHVRNITTPLLILHSEEDYRCPIEQAEQLFVALKLLGQEVEFVRFPNESHGLSRSGRPDHRIDRLERIIDWFDAQI